MSRIDPIRVNYVREFIKLSLWYIHKRVREGLGTFDDAVNLRVNIYRNTSLYDGVRHPWKEDVGPEWAALTQRLKAIYDRHLENPSTEQLEAEALEMLWPYLEARLRRGGDPMPRIEDRPYECWRYDAGSGQVKLHVLNLYRPKSPLSEMYVPFAACLIRLLRDAREQHPGVETASCGSWINAAPRFHALFPASWIQNAVPRPEVRHSMGNWGQFFDRRGDFHVRNGAQFRETGEFPFPAMICESPIEKILAHLESNFPEAVAYHRENLVGMNPHATNKKPG